MFTWLHTLLGGSSPITGYLGSIGTVLSLAQLVTDAIQIGGVPKNPMEWIALICSIGVRFSKDFNKSNAPHPTDMPSTVR